MTGVRILQTLALFALGLATTAPLVNAEAPRQEVSPKSIALGRLTVGAKIDAVPDWAVGGNCNGHVDRSCGFSDPDGLSYWLDNGVVESVSLFSDRYHGAHLPLGLKRGATPDQNVAAVSGALGLPFTKASPGWTTEPLGAAPNGQVRVRFWSGKAASWFGLEIADDQSLLPPIPVTSPRPKTQ